MRKLLIPLILLIITTVSLSITTQIDNINKLNSEDKDFKRKYTDDSEAHTSFDSIDTSEDLLEYEKRVDFF